MTRPTRSTPAGLAYLDLQNRARREGRGTQELLTLYVVERWLARLAQSAYREDFILKGGMLLAAFGARRATADADTLARNMAADEATVVSRVAEIADLSHPEDGVTFQTHTAEGQKIRDEALYSGVRVTMFAGLSTAVVRFRLDVNFGDPITPAPKRTSLPALREQDPAIQLLGYPIETVLAEKIATAIAMGDANTRVRDFADIYTLTGRHDLPSTTMRAALEATVSFRGTPLRPLAAALRDLTTLRQNSYSVYRAGLGPDADQLPEQFAEIVAAVTRFADPIAAPATREMNWTASSRDWSEGR